MSRLWTPDALIIAHSSNPAAVRLLSQAVFSSPFPLNPQAERHPCVSLLIHSPPQIQDLAQGIPGLFSFFLRGGGSTGSNRENTTCHKDLMCHQDHTV